MISASLPTTPPTPTPTFLRLKEVMRRTGLSRSSIYLKVNRGEFPRPHALGPRMIGWLSSDIDAFIASIVAGRYTIDPRPQAGKYKKPEPETATAA